MAGGYYIFSIYKASGSNTRYFVLRTERPAFNNASQNEEDESWEIESAQRSRLLESLGNRESCTDFERIGELHGFPFGDVFYSDSGQLQVPVYYMQTDFGKPWIIFGTADSEEEFLTKLANDDELQALNPIGKPIKIEAYFVTSNDF